MQSFHVRDKSISIYRFLSASSRVRSGSACHHRSSADTSPEATSGASGLNTIPPIPKLPAPASAPRLPGRLPFSVTHTPAKRPLSTNPNWETGSRRGTPAGSQRRAGGRAAARTVARAGRGGACALRAGGRAQVARSTLFPFVRFHCVPLPPRALFPASGQVVGNL